MIRFLSKNYMKTKGYAYSFYFLLPELVCKKVTHFVAGEQRITNISFPTKFCLTTNNIYFNISISVLGFGLGLEVQSRS
jgi:hypothetical protein